MFSGRGRIDDKMRDGIAAQGHGHGHGFVQGFPFGVVGSAAPFNLDVHAVVVLSKVWRRYIPTLVFPVGLMVMTRGQGKKTAAVFRPTGQNGQLSKSGVSVISVTGP
jgi:hypothetical protein